MSSSKKTLFFVKKWLNNYYIIQADVIKETSRFYEIIMSSRKMIFGRYCFLQPKFSKKNTPGFAKLNEAISHIEQQLENDYIESVMLFLSENKKNKKIQKELNELTKRI